MRELFNALGCLFPDEGGNPIQDLAGPRDAWISAALSPESVQRLYGKARALSFEPLIEQLDRVIVARKDASFTDGVEVQGYLEIWQEMLAEAAEDGHVY